MEMEWIPEIRRKSNLRWIRQIAVLRVSYPFVS